MNYEQLLFFAIGFVIGVATFAWTFNSWVNGHIDNIARREIELDRRENSFR